MRYGFLDPQVLGRMDARVARAFEAEELRGRRLEMYGRTIALAVILVLITVVTPFPAALFYYALISVFGALGWLRYWAGRQSWHRSWHQFALAGLEVVLVTYTLLAPNPLRALDIPAQAILHLNNVNYLTVLLAGLAFSYRPGLVLWGGFVGAVSWTVGVLWLMSLPGSTYGSLPEDADIADVMGMIADPFHIDLGVQLQSIVVLLIVSALMAVIVARSRILALRQATLERERSNLARYFPPAAVDRLANQDQAFSATREQYAAVLFADLVGFTAWAERHRAGEVITVLRAVHARFEDAVFRHQGTLDKFIGDGMMATFGTFDPDAEDPAHSLACVNAIMAAFPGGVVPGTQGALRISAGLHYGPVVVGDVGTQRRMELAVLGDTVNVASRLEDMTRDLNVNAAISDTLVQAVRERNPERSEELTRKLRFIGPQMIRGRSDPVGVWVIGGL